MNRIVSLLLLALPVFSISSAGGESTDVTFLISSDTHYGLDQWSTNEALNKECIDRMNAIPGTSYPAEIGGKVDTPRGVVVTGDLTDSGTWDNWFGYGLLWFYRDGFVDDYGVNGDKRVDYPVYEGYGNHDIHNVSSWVVPDGIADRTLQRPGIASISSNGYHYSWDFDNVHLVQLNVYPGGAGDAANSLDFLSQDLADHVGQSRRPVILFHHYGFDPFGTDWWTQEERQAYFDAIEDYIVIGIFCGHNHSTSRRIWNGIDTFTLANASSQRFFVVHVTDNEMVVAARSSDSWGQTWTLDITAEPLPSITVNGGTGHVTVPYSIGVEVRISLDPGTHAGYYYDHWIFAEYNPTAPVTWWWQPPGSWTKSNTPIRASGSPLTVIDNHLVGEGRIPVGEWKFTFAVDALDNTFQGTYQASVEATIF